MAAGVLKSMRHNNTNWLTAYQGKFAAAFWTADNRKSLTNATSHNMGVESVFGFIKMLLRELPGLAMNIANAITMASYNGTYTGSSVIQHRFQNIILPHAVVWAALPKQRNIVSDRFADDTEKQATVKSTRLTDACEAEIKKNEQAVRLKLQYSHMQRITLTELDVIKPTLGKGKLEALLKLQN